MTTQVDQNRGDDGRTSQGTAIPTALTNQADNLCPVCLGYGGEDEPCPECHKQEWRP